MPDSRAGTSPSSSRPSTNGLIVIAAIVGIVIVLGMLAALVVGGEDANDTNPAGSVPAGSVPPGLAVAGSVPAGSIPAFAEIVKPVTIEGDPLPPFTGDGQGDPAVGQLAPIVSGVDYQGNPMTIDAASNGPTMVVLLAHWCAHCNSEIPLLNEWRESGRLPGGLDIVGVSTGVDPNRPNYPPDRWLAAMDWRWPVLVDSDLAEDTDPGRATSAFRVFGGQSFPTMIIIGSDGRVLLRFSGERSVDQTHALVTGALANDTAA